MSDFLKCVSDSCDNMLKPTMRFCNICGTKQEREAPAATTPAAEEPTKLEQGTEAPEPGAKPTKKKFPAKPPAMPPKPVVKPKAQTVPEETPKEEPAPALPPAIPKKPDIVLSAPRMATTPKKEEPPPLPESTPPPIVEEEKEEVEEVKPQVEEKKPSDWVRVATASQPLEGDEPDADLDTDEVVPPPKLVEIPKLAPRAQSPRNTKKERPPRPQEDAAPAPTPVSPKKDKKKKSGGFLDRLKSPRAKKDKKKGGAPAGEVVDLPTPGEVAVVRKTGEISAFGVPLSTMGRSSGKKTRAQMPSEEGDEQQQQQQQQQDSELMEHSVSGVRLRSLDGEIDACENCRRSEAPYFECYLCERVTCPACTWKTLCNLCAPKDAWKGLSVAFQKALDEALACSRRGDLPAAIDHFTVAIAANPSRAQCYFGRGEACQASGQLQLAVQDYSIAIDLSGHLPSLARRMMLYLDEGEREWALIDAERILQVEGTGDAAESLLPRILASSVKLGADEAIEEATKALSVASDAVRVQILVERASLYVQQRSWGNALTDAHRCLSAGGVQHHQLLRARAHLYMGQALQGEGRYMEALALFEQAIRLNAGEEAQLGAALVEYLLGKHQAASEAFRRVPIERKQLALGAWVEQLMRNSRDHYAGCCACALLMGDPDAWSLVPEERRGAIQRMVKLTLIKQGQMDDSTRHVHHPAHVLVRVRVERTQELLHVRVPPQSTVSALMEMLQLMVRRDEEDDHACQLYDPFVGQWLSAYDAVVTYQSVLEYKRRPEGTEGVEVHLQQLGESGTRCYRLPQGATAGDLLRAADHQWGFGIRDPKTRRWMLPTDAVERSGTLELCRLPCAAAMLTRQSLAFNPLSDCGFELDSEKGVRAWGAALGNFGLSPSDVRIEVTALRGVDVAALSAGLNHLTVLTRQGDVKVVGASLREKHAAIPPALQGCTVGVASGFNFSVAVTDCGEVYSWGATGEGLVELPEPAVAVMCGYAFGVAVGVSGLLYTWGTDETSLGREGGGAGAALVAGALASTPVVSVACGIHHCLVLANDGTLYGFGTNNAQQISASTSGASSISPRNRHGQFVEPCVVRQGCDVDSFLLCGEFHSALVVPRRQSTYEGCTVEHAYEIESILTWGDNRVGVLGVEDAAATKGEITTFQGAVVRVVCGKAYMMYYLEESELMAWGKAPHTILKTSSRPISVWKHWMADALSNSRFEESRLEAMRNYSLRYPLNEFRGRISLAGQGLMWLPADLERVPGITELDLTGNLLECLPHSISAFNDLQRIVMLGNPAAASGVLAEEDSLRGVLTRLRRVDSALVQWNGVKVSVVGDPQVGKSTVVSNVLRSCTTLPSGSKSDHLVVTHAQYQGIDVSFFEHCGHQLFQHNYYTRGAVYCIVVDGSSDTWEKKVQRWRRVLLQCVGDAPPPPILVVTTHRQQKGALYAKEEPSAILAAILEAAPLLGSMVPRSFALMQRSLDALSFTTPRLSWPDFCRLAETCLVPKERHAEAARFFHEQGRVLYLPDRVQDEVLLSPGQLDERALRQLHLVFERNDTRLEAWRLPSEPESDTRDMMQYAKFQHHTRYEADDALPAEFYARLVAMVAQHDEWWTVVDAWSGGVVVQSGEETGWLHERRHGLDVVTYLPALTYAASTASEMFPRLVQLVERGQQSFFATHVRLRRSTACPDCVADRGVDMMPFARLKEVWSRGGTTVDCANDHRLDLRAVAPELGLVMVPLVDRVEELPGVEGQLRKGKLRGHVVAMRRLDVSRVRKYGRHDPLQELFLLCHVRHPNVARPFGVLRDELPEYTEVLSHGGCHTLEELMAREGNGGLVGERLPAELQTRIMRDVAEAMRYLHSVPLVHRALRPRNVLMLSVNPEATCVARVSVEVDAMEESDSWRWYAPEVIRGERATVQSDVYSFAIVAYQLSVAGFFDKYKLPFGKKAEADWRKEQRIDEITEQHLRPTLPSLAATWLSALLQRCWHADPAERGTFEQLVADIDAAAPRPSPDVPPFTFPRTEAARRSFSVGSRVLCDLKANAAAVAVQRHLMWVSSDAPAITVVDLQAGGTVVREFVASSQDVPCVITLLKAVGEHQVWGGAQDGTLFVWKMTEPGAAAAAALAAAPKEEKKKKGVFSKLRSKKNVAAAEEEVEDELDLVMVTRVHSNAITVVESAPGDFCVTGDLAGRLAVWHRATKVGDVQFEKPVRSVCFRSRDTIFVGLDTEIHVVKLPSLETLHMWEAHDSVGGISNLLLVGERLFSSANKQIRVWNATSYEAEGEVPPGSGAKIIDLFLLRGFVCAAAVDNVLSLIDPVTLQRGQVLRDEQGQMLAGRGGTLMRSIARLGDNMVASTRNNQVILHTLHEK